MVSLSNSCLIAKQINLIIPFLNINLARPPAMFSLSTAKVFPISYNLIYITNHRQADKHSHYFTLVFYINKQLFVA
ncbi:hypothetical protein BGI33_04975 [Snodgrassella alvi]|nr:hypothetical protein BGI33_04975 [Snodgrassella alvi]PIT19233.1 hypothetical protein BGI34_03175 [Snodgrassella alvi]